MAKPGKKHRTQTLFQKVGEVTVTWAFLEGSVEACIGAIHSKWGGRELNLVIPRTSFARKTQYIRDWYASNETHNVLFPNFMDTIDRLDQLSEHRNRIIHGIAFGIGDYQTTGVNRIRRVIRHKKEPPRVETSAYRLAHLTGLRTQIILFASFMLDISQVFLDVPVSHDNPNKSFSEMLVKLGTLLPLGESFGNVTDDVR